MKWALIVDGEVNQVTDEPFDVSEPWYWAQCPDKVETEWKYDAVLGFKAPKYVAPDPAMSRDYPSYSEQLDMLWHDMNEERIPGKDTSEWYLMVKGIKEAHPK
jgi:hypothetical protein